MSYMAFNRACSVAWAILPESLQQLLDIASREHVPDFEAVEARRSRRMDGNERVKIRNGVAVLDITGPIFRYADVFTAVSGATAISTLARDFTAAIEDPNVSSILLNIDSPGGEVAGINEFAQMVFEGRSRKPVVAYIDGYGASAAYWIASAAEEIVADKTALIGSIGVVAAVPNPDSKSARDVQFVSSQSPKKRPNPNTESGKEQLQAMVDDLAEVFVSTVARNRSTDVDTVLADFGQGAVLVGEKAVAAGLADRIGSFESLLAEMAGRRNPKKMSAIAGEENDDMKIEDIKNRIMAIFSEAPAEEPVEAAEPEASETSKPEGVIAAENEALRRQIAEQQAATWRESAEAFVAVQISAGKLLPAERDAVVEDFIQAAADDQAMPPADGNFRLTRLRSRIEARSSHNLFEETVTSRDHQILASDENAQTEMNEDRRRELLSKTPTGKSALKAVK